MPTGSQQKEIPFFEKRFLEDATEGAGAESIPKLDVIFVAPAFRSPKAVKPADVAPDLSPVRPSPAPIEQH